MNADNTQNAQRTSPSGTPGFLTLVVYYFARRFREVWIRAFISRRDLIRMDRQEDERLREISEAVRHARLAAFSQDERAWVERVESVRDRVTSRDEQVEIVPLGNVAGEPKEVNLGNFARLSSMSTRWCCFVFQLIRHLRPSSCLEMGSCVGVSSCYIGAAFDLNSTGILHTIEGQPGLARCGEEHIQGLGLSKHVSLSVGSFDEVLPSLLEDISPLKVAFVDGGHTEQHTVREFERLLKCSEPGTVLVFDDTGWSHGMKRAWDRIRLDRNVLAAIDLTKLGIVVVGEPTAEGPIQYRVAI